MQSGQSAGETPGTADTADTAGAQETLRALWSPLLAITTQHAGRANGQITVAALSASILPDAPQVLFALWKANLTHDLVRASGVFALHLLPAGPDEALVAALPLIEALGLRSGRDGDKMVGLHWHAGGTGSPILEDALTYVEGRVRTTLDAGEMTVFFGEVTAGQRLRAGEALTWRVARDRVPAAWREAFDANQHNQRAEARRLRGLPALPAQ